MSVRHAAGLAALLSLAAAQGAGAVEVPFLEDFDSDAADWLDFASAPLAWQASGGPDGSSYATGEFNYLGFESGFGAGPVVLRAHDTAQSSGDAFVGDWIAAGVSEVRAWVRHDTGEDLTFYVRIATGFNFPGTVIDDDVAVPSGVWTQISLPLDPKTCESETGGNCDEILTDVGNLQIGTLPSEALTLTDESFRHDVDKVELVAAPEPAQALLAAAGAAALAAARRRRRG